MSKYEELKARAQLFKAGSIVPRRALKCTKRKAQHLVTFWADTYVIPGPTGYVMFAEGLNDFFLSHRTGHWSLGQDHEFQGSPYHPGDTVFHMHRPGCPVEEFQERVLQSMRPPLPSKIRWIDNSEYVPK